MMALDRNKVTRAAEKLVSRGKLNAAIDEYRKLLADSPNDTTTLNRVGDLYARLNRLDKAIDLFKKTADHFIEEGFFVKAIAIYKKIIRLDPTQIEVYEKLADLYDRQGLVNESRSQYQVVADYYQKHGRTQSTIAVYRKLIELESDNPSHRLRLAELLRNAERPQEAVAQYREIASLLLGHGRVEDATKVFVTALEVDAGDLDFVTDALVELKAAGHAAAAERLLGAAVERNREARKLSRLLGMEAETLRPPTPREKAAEAAGEEPSAAEVAATELEGEDIVVLDLDDEELSPSPEMVPELLGEPVVPVAVEDSEIEIDLDGLEQARLGDLAVSEEELAQAEKLDELLAEAETLAKFGLVDKAAHRLEEVIALDSARLEAYDPLLSLYLDRQDRFKVLRLAEQLADLAAGGEAIEVWQGIRERLREEGYQVSGDQIVPPEEMAVADVDRSAAPAATGAGEPPAGAADWLQGAAPDKAGVDELFRDEEEFFDLASELEEELRQEGELQADEELLEPLDEQSVEQIVAGFRKGMVDTLSAEDYDTHYNLGIAYREMGLVDEAIGEFQLAAKDPRYLVECCSLLAASFIDKGFPELAVKWYVRGLDSPSLSEEESLGLLYELGNLYLSMGDKEKARQRFVEIYGVNSNYRDVVAKLQELGSAGSAG